MRRGGLNATEKCSSGSFRTNLNDEPFRLFVRYDKISRYRILFDSRVVKILVKYSGSL